MSVVKPVMADASVHRSKRLTDSRQPIPSSQKALALLSGLIPGRKSKHTITSSNVPTNLLPTSTNTQINADPPFEDIDPTRDQLDTPSSRDTTNNAIDSIEHISTVSGAQDLGKQAGTSEKVALVTIVRWKFGSGSH